MNPSELRFLIRGTLLEVMDFDTYLQRAKELSTASISALPKPPVLSKEQQLQAVQAFRALPFQRRKLLAQIMRHPCTYCESKTGGLGWSHGICDRHSYEMKKAIAQHFGKPEPQFVNNPKNKALDIENTLSKEEIQIGVNLFAISYAQKSKF